MALIDGLINYWKLEEAAGNARVASAGGVNLIEGGSAVPNEAGKIGNAATVIRS